MYYCLCLFQVTFSSLVRYLDRQGLFYRELHEGSMFRADMQTAPAFFMSLLGAINLTASRYYVKVNNYVLFWANPVLIKNKIITLSW